MPGIGPSTCITRPPVSRTGPLIPTALVEPWLLAGSKPGDWVLDPCMGSGTVGVVAQRHGRHFLGIDIQADYHALAEQRLARGK